MKLGNTAMQPHATDSADKLSRKAVKSSQSAKYPKLIAHFLLVLKYNLILSIIREHQNLPIMHPVRIKTLFLESYLIIHFPQEPPHPRLNIRYYILENQSYRKRIYTDHSCLS